MLLVPLASDAITSDGVDLVVLSYIHSSTPSVICEDNSGQVRTVKFSDIQRINGTPVEITPGAVFKSASLIARRLHLPQPDDMVIANGTRYRVKSAKSFRKHYLSYGMFLVCKNLDTLDNMEYVPLSEISSIERADGSIESADEVLKTYAEYTGVSK